MIRPIRSYSLNNALMIIFSLIFIGIIGMLSFFQYGAVAADQKGQFSDEISKTDLILNHSVSVLFEALNLYDSRYDYEMEMVLSRLSDTYVGSGNDISQINLTGFKEEISPIFPGDVDLYIINSSNIVEHTTYDPDINLNFTQFPEFAKSLSHIRNNPRFVADQWVDSINTPGYYRKYAYYPTPDHRYILEIGVHSDEFWQARREIFSYEKLGRQILEINPDLVAISFFNKNVDPISDSGSPGHTTENSSVSQYITVEDLNSTIRSVFAEKKATVQDTGLYLVDYQFFTIRHDITPSSSEMNVAAVLVYSRANLDRSLSNYLLIHVCSTFFAVILAVLFAMYISRYISRPLEQIIEDIEQIARGDYHHSVRKTGGSDIDRLGHSVGIMVQKILYDIEIIQSGHEEIAAELERRKAAEEALIIANNKLNNLSSITRHDILNQVTCIRGYAFLAENSTCQADNVLHAQNIQRISRLIEEMIAFSRDYQTIGISSSSWQNLDKGICDAISGPFSDRISLQTSGTNVSILADPLLQKVFYNLAHNSLTHAGPGGEKILISFEKTDADGVIVYEDKGRGIPDSEKELIFERGYGSGSGLGLFLIREILAITGMSITETGTYGSGARFEIHVPADQWKVDPDT
nr:HAMP domain-containing sensor histidine kinase [uncultured Methanospirillum sp.]